MTENNRIEYKRELTDGLEKEVVAFLNKDGGDLYIGIDDKGNSIGVKHADSDMLKIKDRLKNNISPSCVGFFDIVSAVQEGREIIKITLAGGS
jgi:ATP-dependent DNA helicase RecG